MKGDINIVIGEMAKLIVKLNDEALTRRERLTRALLQLPADLLLFLWTWGGMALSRPWKTIRPLMEPVAAHMIAGIVIGILIFLATGVDPIKTALIYICAATISFLGVVFAVFLRCYRTTTREIRERRRIEEKLKGLDTSRVHPTMIGILAAHLSMRIASLGCLRVILSCPDEAQWCLPRANIIKIPGDHEREETKLWVGRAPKSWIEGVHWRRPNELEIQQYAEVLAVELMR